MVTKEEKITYVCNAVIDRAVLDFSCTADGDWFCVFCNAEGSRENIIHDENCPVVVAKDLRAGASITSSSRLANSSRINLMFSERIAGEIK